VSGTALHPIEFGAIAALTIPLAIGLLLIQRRHVLITLVVLLLVELTIPMSVSRSAILGLGVACLLYIPLHGARSRALLSVFAPLGLVVLGLSAPGYLATIRTTILGSSTDTSVITRLADYRVVAERFSEHPWLGSGVGSYIPTDAIQILDNQYLKSLIEVGAIGLVGVVAFVALPWILALDVRRRTSDPALRELLAGLAAGCLAAMILCATFDAFSFPTFTLTFALMAGLIGACWRIAAEPPTRLPELAGGTS
jgi:O-antigen ligase